MPVYEYLCDECGGYTTRYRSIQNRHNPLVCECGSGMELAIVTPPAGSVQAEAHYVCPVTGEKVTSWRQRKNIFAKHNLIDANEVGIDGFKKERLKKKAERDRLAKNYLPADLKEQLSRIGRENKEPSKRFCVE